MKCSLVIGIFLQQEVIMPQQNCCFIERDCNQLGSLHKVVTINWSIEYIGELETDPSCGVGKSEITFSTTIKTNCWNSSRWPEIAFWWRGRYIL